MTTKVRPIHGERLLAATAGLLVLALGGCSGAVPEAPEKVTARVQVQAAAVRDFDDAVIAYGVLEPSVEEARSVSAQVEAQVTAVFVQPGESVRKGQKLLRLSPSAVTALDAGRARRDALAADVEAQRVSRLRAQGLATESELQAAKAASDSARPGCRDLLELRGGQWIISAIKCVLVRRLVTAMANSTEIGVKMRLFLSL